MSKAGDVDIRKSGTFLNINVYESSHLSYALTLPAKLARNLEKALRDHRLGKRSR